jgi:ABC-type multidrug transport system ATPase subunit
MSQDDLLFPMLTVKETLMFSAFFRLPLSQSKAVKIARVIYLLEQLGLLRVANSLIGDEGYRGISGGERRRVSIGIDIIHDPQLLFLDEPTSGLDSTSAFMVVSTNYVHFFKADMHDTRVIANLISMKSHQESYATKHIEIQNFAQ